MKLEFFYDSTVEPFKADDLNLPEVLDLLKRLKGKKMDVVAHDVAGWDDAMRMEHYLRGVVPAVMKKYGIRRVFGSARTSGWLFGRQVPALIVTEDGRVVDIYPHTFAGNRFTILGVLRELFSKVGGGGKR